MLVSLTLAALAVMASAASAVRHDHSVKDIERLAPRALAGATEPDTVAIFAYFPEPGCQGGTPYFREAKNYTCYGPIDRTRVKSFQILGVEDGCDVYARPVPCGKDQGGSLVNGPDATFTCFNLLDQDIALWTQCLRPAGMVPSPLPSAPPAETPSEQPAPQPPAPEEPGPPPSEPQSPPPSEAGHLSPNDRQPEWAEGPPPSEAGNIENHPSQNGDSSFRRRDGRGRL